MINNDSIKKLLSYVDDSDVESISDSISSTLDTMNHIKKESTLNRTPYDLSEFINLDEESLKHVSSLSDGWGLVLAGGGGKGAYQAGVIKAVLDSNKIDIKACVGNSAGGLNAALFSALPKEKLFDIWKSIDQLDVLTPEGMSYEEIDTLRDIEFFSESEIYSAVLSGLLNQKGAYSRHGLSRVIENTGVMTELNMSKTPCFVTCFNIDKLRCDNIFLNNLTPFDIESALLATSAIPAIFEPVTFLRGRYLDGGFPYLGNNTPLSPLYKLGFRRFLVIHLSPRKQRAESVNSLKLNRRLTGENLYTGATYVHIFPNKNLGNMFEGTLNFEDNYIDSLLDMGYNDMKSKLPDIDLAIESTPDEFGEIHILNGRKYRNYDEVLDSLIKK